MKIEKPVFYKDIKVIFYCKGCGVRVMSLEGLNNRTQMGMCIICRRKWYKENYVYKPTYSKKSYEAYKKRIKRSVWTYMHHKKIMADSQKKNRHKYKAYYHQYYLEHKEEYRQNCLRHRAKLKKKKLASV